jgi:hypothetical protein
MNLWLEREFTEPPCGGFSFKRKLPSIKKKLPSIFIVLSIKNYRHFFTISKKIDGNFCKIDGN